jgi:carbon storage regulator
MLVLTRRPGEKLILETSDGPIEILIASIGGQQTQVGVDAPESVTVLREELREEN